MRLIMNFNRTSFDQFGWDAFDRIELDEGADGTLRMTAISEGGERGYAFSPANASVNEGEDGEGSLYRYKVRVPEEDAEILGLQGSYRYEVDLPLGSDEYVLTPHSVIYPGFPERHDVPLVSVSFTETEGRTGEDERPFVKTARRMVTGLPNGSDADIIMNTLLGGMVPVYMDKNRKTGAIRPPESFINPKRLRDEYGDVPPEVVHIRPWETGADEDEKFALLTDMDNLWFLHPYLRKLFEQGDFSVADEDGHLVFAPDSEAEDLFRVSPKVSFFSFKINKLPKGMMDYFKWHRENVLRT